MPLYEYECRHCGHQFEALVRPGHVIACAACGSGDLDRLLSSFAPSSDGSRRANLSAVRARGERLRHEKVRADHRAMHDHIKDHS